MAAFDPQHQVRSFSERHEDHFHPSASHAPDRAGVLLHAGHRPCGRKRLAALRENDGIDLSIVSEEFPAKPGEPKRPPGFVLLDSRNSGPREYDDERDEQVRGMELASDAEEKVETKAVGLRALRGRAPPGASRASSQRTRALRVRGAPGGAGLADVVDRQLRGLCAARLTRISGCRPAFGGGTPRRRRRV